MRHIFNIRFWTFGGWFTWVAVAIAGTALIGAGTSIYEGDQSRKAISQEQSLLAGLTYTPIDVSALQSAATKASIDNATQSLNLQRTLQPDVYRSNVALQKSVADQLALGGNLPPDIANQVAQAGRVAGSSSGNGGNAAPITAALLGQSALGLLNQRQTAAEQLSATNPAPSVGLSPADLASAIEANNNAQNQFTLAKAGAQTNLINSQAQSNSATAAGVGGSLSSALSLLALAQGRPAPTAPPISSVPNTTPVSIGTPTVNGGTLTFPGASGSIIGGI